MRKAQSEMLGLVLIVLLISVGILIAIVIFSKPIGKEVRYEQEGFFAANFLSTLVKSDSDCRGRSVGELLQDCAETHGNSAIVCGERDSCGQARFLISNLLDVVFSERGVKFYFTISDREGNTPDSLEDFVFGEPCSGEFESKTRPLVFNNGVIYLKLDICH
ncbi:MAG TPA: hypothetical protein ENF94_01395 [Candidatus Woesearchaeota archaeon]|nr:MAG: hypothetical protein DRJ25_00035 [Candidatus Woesearchaeota archaeon]HDD70795.1 hypothetical protein [Candidatus Woesearchaeota archaeon]